jgi:arginine/lysine/ornithine decarboxylase
MAVNAVPVHALPPLGSRLGASSHQHAPFLDALDAYREAKTVSFSTPGHKGGAGAEIELRELLGASVFAADVWLNSGDHASIQRAAEDLAADAWGAERSFFLTNGSSAGNHAALLALLGPDDEVVVARDMHSSVLTALIHTGARPTYITPARHPYLDIGLGVAPEAIDAALKRSNKARLVVVTSPTYWGIASDIAGIAAVAHAHGVPLYVDEAWGPHLPFHPCLPPSAMASGADIAVTSVHKLLGGLGQAAILHAQGTRLDLRRLSTTVRMGQTTSPSVPILTSIDACRRQMALEGERLMARALGLAADARERLAAIPGIRVLDASQLGLPAHRVDATRLVIDVQGLGLTGFVVERALRDRFAVAVEMSDLLGIVALVTVGDDRDGIDRLAHAIGRLAGETNPVPLAGAAALPRSAGIIATASAPVLSPREAFFASSRSVPLRAATGEVAAELIVPYPPGIPILVPGERISEEKRDYLIDVLRCGAHIRGTADPDLKTIQVVAPEGLSVWRA